MGIVFGLSVVQIPCSVNLGDSTAGFPLHLLLVSLCGVVEFGARKPGLASLLGLDGCRGKHVSQYDFLFSSGFSNTLLPGQPLRKYSQAFVIGVRIMEVFLTFGSAHPSRQFLCKSAC